MTKLKIFSVKRYVLSVLALLIVSSPITGAVDYDFYSGNDVIFYDPTATPACSGEGTIIVTTSKEALANLKQAYAYFIAKGLKDYQSAGIIGNMHHESGGYTNQLQGSPPGKGPSTPAGVSNGWGLVQWTPGSKFLTLQKQAGVSGSPVDLQTQLDVLWWQLSAGDEKVALSSLKQTSDVSSATKSFLDKYERAGVSALQDRINFAKEALSTFPKTTGGSSPTSVDSSGCSDGSAGIVQGNIIKTAQGFALPQPVANTSGGWKSEAKPSFVSAVQQYDSSVLSLGEAAYADCGIFVATVMHASGVDKSYPDSGTINQMKYVKDHTDKYKIINNPQLSDLQPGDILLVNNGSDHHTMIYTGEIGTSDKTGAKLIAVDASQEQRPPSYRSTGDVQWMLGRSGVIAVRLK